MLEWKVPGRCGRREGGGLILTAIPLYRPQAEHKAGKQHCACVAGGGGKAEGVHLPNMNFFRGKWGSGWGETEVFPEEIRYVL